MFWWLHGFRHLSLDIEESKILDQMSKLGLTRRERLEAVKALEQIFT